MGELRRSGWRGRVGGNHWGFDIDIGWELRALGSSLNASQPGVEHG